MIPYQLLTCGASVTFLAPLRTVAAASSDAKVTTGAALIMILIVAIIALPFCIIQVVVYRRAKTSTICLTTPGPMGRSTE